MKTMKLLSVLLCLCSLIALIGIFLDEVIIPAAIIYPIIFILALVLSLLATKQNLRTKDEAIK